MNTSLHDISNHIRNTSNNDQLLDLFQQITRQIRANGARDKDKLTIYQDTAPEVADKYDNCKGNQDITIAMSRAHYAANYKKKTSRHGVDGAPTPSFEGKNAKLSKALRLSSSVATFDKSQNKLDTTETLNVKLLCEHLENTGMSTKTEILNTIHSFQLRDDKNRLFVFDSQFRAEKLLQILLSHNFITQSPCGMLQINKNIDWSTSLAWSATLTKKVEEGAYTAVSIYGPERKPVFVAYFKSSDLFGISKFSSRYQKYNEILEINKTTKPEAGSPYDAVTLKISDVIDLPSFELVDLDCHAMNVYGAPKEEQARIQDELYLKLKKMPIAPNIKQHLDTYYANHPPKRTRKKAQDV